MPPATLVQLKDRHADLHGEDGIALFATMAARRHVNEMIEGGGTEVTNRLHFGPDGPNHPSATENCSMTFGELLERTGPASQAAKAARGRLMAFAFALREHVHRPAISQECGLQRVDSDAFGDLRHCRNAILHDNGMLEKGATALTVLGKGDAMEPANDELHGVFGQLAPALNDAGLTCYGEPRLRAEARIERMAGSDDLAAGARPGEPLPEHVLHAASRCR